MRGPKLEFGDQTLRQIVHISLGGDRFRGRQRDRASGRHRADVRRCDRLLVLYDSGDGLHPNHAGLQAMGEAVDLSLFSR
jgi:lysophospholipase L1-like esterase